jgi:hypothetical protein
MNTDNLIEQNIRLVGYTLTTTSLPLPATRTPTNAA